MTISQFIPLEHFVRIPHGKKDFKDIVKWVSKDRVLAYSAQEGGNRIFLIKVTKHIRCFDNHYNPAIFSHSILFWLKPNLV